MGSNPASRSARFPMRSALGSFAKRCSPSRAPSSRSAAAADRRATKGLAPAIIGALIDCLAKSSGGRHDPPGGADFRVAQAIGDSRRRDGQGPRGA